MRPAQTFGGIALLLALAANARAEPVTVLYTATVQAPDAVARCGPSDKMDATNRLPKDSTVQVVKELEGWLGIKAPSPSSFDWVQTRFLQRNAPNSNAWTVVSDPETPVQVFYGSELVNKEPTTVSCQLARGAQVVGLGPERSSTQHGMLLPIQAPDKEIRYVRADAVAKAPTQTAGTGGIPGLPVSYPRSAPGQVATATPHPLWLQAQDQEHAGNLLEAIRIYKQLADQVARTDNELAMQCVNRMHFLNERLQASPPGVAPQGYSTVPGYPGGPVDNRLAPAPAVPGYTAPQSPTVAQYPSPRPAPAATSGMQSSGPGRLRRAGRCVDCRQAYVLESSQGQLLMYVTAQPGLSLEPFVNTNVELYGTMSYNGDLRANYMTAVQASPVR